LLTLLISGGVCLGLLSAPALRDHLQMAREVSHERVRSVTKIVLSFRAWRHRFSRHWNVSRLFRSERSPWEEDASRDNDIIRRRTRQCVPSTRTRKFTIVSAPQGELGREGYHGVSLTKNC
jgi:hypothetical protein